MELNPHPDFDSDSGYTFSNAASVTGGQLVLHSGNASPGVSWVSPETITEGYYRYDVTVSETGAVEDECLTLSVAGRGVLLYGAGRFQGVIWTHAPLNQLIVIRANDPEFIAKLSHCSIARE